ncbi:dihydroorotase [Deinococcus metallilatus]|uniref:Dihydroorotase n=1 Tax=Deinococcus metallilatus TaxID=1211322 RepID=A0AAJ5F7M4_9DEIO|nr:dihydroorotase [Deinococcus metallilatus]MBB5294827.1 dihydroorotase [Deinococcus metallilatus]QBY09456.1 dihydroorotase [Deinococcus metallilatus]RXJ09461.1 dihydroorotase [Deinococcus metallilatus]TLK28984.1 dihydroorotase [Deinococcus metallilatus]GMA16754.1 dihydroorotase [Deinococcus metallilatus]
MFTITNIKRPGSDRLESVTVENGVIKGWNLPAEGEIIDGKGGTVAPALIELHAHLREPGQTEKEDLASGLAAAAAGGYGTVVSMPNTTPVVDDPATVRSLIEKAEGLGLARLKPAAALTKGQKGEQLAELAFLKDAGAAMFTDDGRTNENARVLCLGLEYARSLGMVVSVHAEDAALRADGVMNEGLVSEELGLPGNPWAAEAARVARDMEIVALTGARLHVQHLSTARALDLVREAKKRGLPVTCEVCPHHLTLTDEALRTFDALYKVAPPLRTQADAEYLLEGLLDGTVDCLATDHAPHTRAEKERDLLDAPFGIAYIELAFPLMWTRFGEQLGLEKLLDLMTAAPARVMGWPEPTLEAGAPADLVVLDLATEREVNPAEFRSKAKFSPWTGERLKGWPLLTVVDGKIAFQRED